MKWLRMPCPTGCGKSNGSSMSCWRPGGHVRKYRCKQCGVIYYVQFDDAADAHSADQPHTYHKVLPSTRDPSLVNRLAGSTFVPPPDTRWTNEVTPQVTNEAEIEYCEICGDDVNLWPHENGCPALEEPDA